MFVFMEEKDCAFSESMECRGYNQSYGCSCNPLSKQAHEDVFLVGLELKEEGELA